ncbi:MAG TPA: hypothetical protein VF600_15540 [Abditibacteriaceae bacterium]|jgi:hypothetical protein
MPGRVWTQERLIETIRQLNEQGVDLSPTAIQKTHGALFSSARSRSHFGNWRDAVQAAGLSYDEIKRVKQRWSREEILQQIKQCHTCGEDLLHPGFKEKNRSLYLAACAHRYFGSWRRAIRAAGLDHETMRESRVWTKARILRTIQEMQELGQPLGWAHIKNACPGIYRAARRKENFGSWHNALIAAGIEPAPRGRGRRPNALKELERGLTRDIDTPAQPMVYDGAAPALRSSSLEALSSR